MSNETDKNNHDYLYIYKCILLSAFSITVRTPYHTYHNLLRWLELVQIAHVTNCACYRGHIFYGFNFNQKLLIIKEMHTEKLL